MISFFSVLCCWTCYFSEIFAVAEVCGNSSNGVTDSDCDNDVSHEIDDIIQKETDENVEVASTESAVESCVLPENCDNADTAV